LQAKYTCCPFGQKRESLGGSGVGGGGVWETRGATPNQPPMLVGFQHIDAAIFLPLSVSGMESGVDANEEVSRLIGNVSAWLSLQSEESATLMAETQRAHLEIIAALKAATEHCELPIVDMGGVATRGEAQSPPHADAATVDTAAGAAFSSALRSVALSPATPPAPPAIKDTAITTPAAVTLAPAASRKPFTSIDTVLAARRRRLSIQGSSSPSRPITAVALFERSSSPRAGAEPDGPTTPPSMASTPSSAASELVSEAFERWRIGVVSLCHPTDFAMAVAAAPRLARLAGWRRFRLRWSGRAAGAIDRCRALQHALRHGWGLWRLHLAAATSRRDAAALQRLATDEHARRASQAAAFHVWRRTALCCVSRREALAIVDERTRRSRCSRGVGVWRAWLRRRAAWRRSAQRRASALGGWTKHHLPCMRAFDGRAIFLEEGSLGLANAFRRRRIAAVVLCSWMAIAVGASPASTNSDHPHP
jgi:hypothetical protein